MKGLGKPFRKETSRKIEYITGIARKKDSIDSHNTDCD